MEKGKIRDVEREAGKPSRAYSLLTSVAFSMAILLSFETGKYVQGHRDLKQIERIESRYKGKVDDLRSYYGSFVDVNSLDGSVGGGE